MNIGSVLGHLFHPRPTEGRPTAEPAEADQPIRLPPTLAAEDLPPEFENVLDVQVLGYRERMAFVAERRMHVLDPVWTLVPKDK